MFGQKGSEEIKIRLLFAMMPPTRVYDKRTISYKGAGLYCRGGETMSNLCFCKICHTPLKFQPLRVKTRATEGSDIFVDLQTELLVAA